MTSAASTRTAPAAAANGPLRRRLLILTDGFPPYDVGGAERIAYYHSIALARAGFDVAVFTGTEAPERSVFDDPEGIRVHRGFVLDRGKGPFGRALSKATVFARILRNPVATASLRSVVRELSPELVHAHYVSEMSLGWMDLPELARVPKLVTFHGYQFECPKGGLFRKRGEICESKPLGCRIFALAAQRALARASRIIAISRFIEKRLCDQGYSSDVVRYLPNGVPGLEERAPMPIGTVPRVLFVGRVTPNKGVLGLIEAFRGIAMPEAELEIVGEGPSLAACVAAAAGDRRISFLGRLPHGQVAQRYQAARVVAVPSLWHEVMNTVICEAQSWSRPVVATRVGGNEDLIEDGVSGFLCRPGDTQGLRERLARLLASPEVAGRIGAGGFAHVQRFSMARHVAALRALYAELDG